MMRLAWHGVAVGMLLSSSLVAQQPMPAEQQAEVMLTAARKGYAETLLRKLLKKVPASSVWAKAATERLEKK